MHGVTTALVGFLFVCVVFPHLVKNRPQYYAAFGFVCGIILLDALGFMLRGHGFSVFVYFAIAFLQVGAILLLFLAAGGITWRQLAGDMKNAYEVIRRGGEEKEIIIPLRGKMPGGGEAAPARNREDADEKRERIVIDDPAVAPAPAGQPAPPPAAGVGEPKKPETQEGIPLEP